MRRKIMATIVSMIMVISMFTGCMVPVSAEEGETRKIGVILYGKDDTMGSAVYSYLNFAAEAIGVDITWAFGDYDAAAQLTTCQNMVAAGCEGILMMPMDNAAVQQVASYCEQNQVYFGLMFRDITDDTIKETVESYEYYVVDGFENDEYYAERMIEYMVEEYGATNFGEMSMYESSPLASRNTGFDNGFESTEAERLAEFAFPTDSNTQTIAAGIENFINSYSEMDAIVLGASSVGAGETVMNTLQTLTEEGSIKVGTFDAFEGMDEAFESGYLVYVAGGMGLESVFDFIVLYNAVDGTPLSDDLVILNMSEIEVKSAEDCANYSLYIDNADYQIFAEEEIQAMCVRYNADASLEDIQSYIDSFSLEWVVERAAE
ncbi:MAG: substrate-binding domain-containing protein [Clostridiales bacterium]|nr:substrate-binding domain-containing protein [Clostridiales bacterium]